MEFGFFTISLLVIAGVLVLSGLRLLLAAGWFLQFLRGFAGFGQILIALIIVLVGVNLASYSQLDAKQDLANISFKKVDSQRFEASIASVSGGLETKFIVDGDMWQVTSRALSVMGSSSRFYKMNSISGRYYSLEQQRSSAQSFSSFKHESVGIDLWGMFNGKDIGLVGGDEIKSKFIPMSDGAVFSISIGADDSLDVEAVNDEAKKIVNEWK